MSRLRPNMIDKIIRAISTLFILIVLNVLAATPVHAAPNLSVQMDQSPAGVTLSTEGTSDWAHWGLSNASSFNHKSGVHPADQQLHPPGFNDSRADSRTVEWPTRSGGHPDCQC